MSTQQVVNIPLNLHPRQGAALLSDATEILYGGAAGGGKSFLMRAAAILWCTQIAGLQVYVFRRLFPDLIKNHMEGPKGFRALLAGWEQAGFIKIVEEEIRFWNGSRIYLCHCKDDGDRYKYQGAEIHVLLIDELTHFSEVVYRFLRGRTRMVGITVPEQYRGKFPRILCASNPGNIGHLWVKATFIDNVRPMELRPMSDGEGGMVRQFIPAKLEDNPSMQEDDPSYRAKLRGLGNEALVRAMEDGDWDVVAGAFFEAFDRKRHVIEPFAIPGWWMRFGSFDWGSARPFSYGLYAVSDGTRLKDGKWFPAGALIRYQEWYGASAPNVGLKLTAEQVAEGIKSREGKQSISFRVADPACWKWDGGPSIAERMAVCGVDFIEADNSRIAGWDQVRDRLLGEEEPMLYFFDTCDAMIRTLPAVQHDERRPEDVLSSGEDHAVDELRYAVMARPYIRHNENSRYGGEGSRRRRRRRGDRTWLAA